jgi:hypothetical protein
MWSCACLRPGALTGGSVECELSFRSLPGTTEAGGIYRTVGGDVLVRIGEKVWGMTAGCCGEPAGRGHQMRGVNGRGNGGHGDVASNRAPRHAISTSAAIRATCSGLSVFRGSGP